MSRNVLGAIGGTAALLALVILFGAYEVQQEKFPGWLFASAVIVGVLLLVGGYTGVEYGLHHPPRAGVF